MVSSEAFEQEGFLMLEFDDPIIIRGLSEVSKLLEHSCLEGARAFPVYVKDMSYLWPQAALAETLQGEIDKHRSVRFEDAVKFDVFKF